MAPSNFHAANWQKDNHCCQSLLVSSHGKYFFFFAGIFLREKSNVYSRVHEQSIAISLSGIPNTLLKHHRHWSYFYLRCFLLIYSVLFFFNWRILALQCVGFYFSQRRFYTFKNAVVFLYEN